MYVCTYILTKYICVKAANYLAQVSLETVALAHRHGPIRSLRQPSHRRAARRQRAAVSAAMVGRVATTSVAIAGRHGRGAGAGAGHEGGELMVAEEADPRLERLAVVKVGGDVLAKAVREDQRAAGARYNCIGNSGVDGGGLGVLAAATAVAVDGFRGPQLTHRTRS